MRQIVVSQSNRTRKVQELRRLIAEANETLRLMERFGPDDYAEGTVIKFEKQFHRGERWYSYSAIKAGGVWYTTGPQSPKAYSWDDLTDWLASGDVRDFAVAVGWDPIG